MGWWIVLCAVLGAIFVIVSILFWQLFRYQKSVRPELPLRMLGGIPLLIQNELPYPSYFSFTSNTIIDLSGDWQFGVGSVLAKKDLPLKTVQIPVSFNTFGSELAEYQGPFSYVRRFNMDAVEDRLYRLCFKGVGGCCSVYLNDKKLCDNTDSYQPFYCNATGALQAGENVLIVVGDNTPTETTLPPRQFEGHRPGWHLYAGVTKGVLLEALPADYCVNLRVSAVNHTLSGSAVFAGRPQRCEIRLSDGGRTIAEQELVLFGHDDYSTAKFTFDRLSGIEPWSPESPKLYTLEAQTEAENVCISVGFREWSVENAALKLNGKPFCVRGVCLHEEDVALGASLDKRAVARNLDLARELGCNFVRLAHYPHSDEALDYCDEKGLCCWSEIPNYQAGLGLVQLLFGKSERLKKRITLCAVRQGILGTRQLVDERYLTDAGVQVAKMVIRNQNRPSVTFWGVGNECYSFTPASRDALHFLRDTVRLFDPARFVGYASFTAPTITRRFEKSFQVFDFVCANEYYGWYYGKAEDCGAFWNALQKKYRKPMLCTETGSDARQGAQGVDLIGRKANSEDYQASLLSRHIRLKDDVPMYCGTCVWALKDFYCEEYGEGDIVPYFNAKGLVSSDYRKKKAFAAVAGSYSKERSE